MNNLTIFVYEWKHFIRNPFKIVALFLFVAAAAYALHNGASLFQEQVAEIDRISGKAAETKEQTMAFYDKGEKGPKGRPWIDVTTPFWAIWNTPVHHFKSPSPALVFSIGQTEQYGFYKRVTFNSSPYDADMAEEIANPERLQAGTLDFSFVVLYLMPLLLLIWLYNIKGAEGDGGFLPLIYAQTGTKNSWLLTRVGFYSVLMMLVVLALMLYGSILTHVLNSASDSFWQIFATVSGYLFLWALAFTLILYKGESSIANTLKMVGVWLLFAFVIPSAVHQWVATQYPANLMTDLIDAQREEREALYALPDSVFQAHLNKLFPDIPDSPVYQDNNRRNLAMNRSSSALTNELTKKGVVKIEHNSEDRNNLIRSSFWFNPVTFFQNRLNLISRTHYQDYQDYRAEVQLMIDEQIRTMVLDTWRGVVVDKDRYLEYNQQWEQ